MFANVTSIKNEGIVLSQFKIDPDKEVLFGATHCRDKKLYEKVRPLKTVRVLTKGWAKFKSGNIEKEMYPDDEPLRSGSPFYTRVKAGPKGCEGVFLGFNVPNVKITSIERKLFYTEEQLSFDTDCVIAVLSNNVKVNGEELGPMTPLKVEKGSILNVGLGATDLIMIKYQ